MCAAYLVTDIVPVPDLQQQQNSRLLAGQAGSLCAPRQLFGYSDPDIHLVAFVDLA